MSIRRGTKVVSCHDESKLGVVSWVYENGDSIVMWGGSESALERTPDIRVVTDEMNQDGMVNDVIKVACALIREGLSDHDIVGVKAVKIVKSIYKELAK